jgi:hypothetical protein
MFTHTITRKWSSAGASLSKAESLTGSGEVNVDQAVDASEPDLLVSYAVLVDQLRSLYILSTTDIVITPHDSGDSPLDTIELSANIPFEWTYTSGLDNPYSDDVASLHVENLDATEGLLSMRTLIDASPLTLS